MCQAACGSYLKPQGFVSVSVFLVCKPSDSLLLCLQELTLTHPNIVNAKKNTELTFGKGTFLSNHQ